MDKIDFFIFYFVLSTTIKYDTEIIILSCLSLSNIIKYNYVYVFFSVLSLLSSLFFFFFFKDGN